jgi:hypothetical protein
MKAYFRGLRPSLRPVFGSKWWMEPVQRVLARPKLPLSTRRASLIRLTSITCSTSASIEAVTFASGPPRADVVQQTTHSIDILDDSPPC